MTDQILGTSPKLILPEQNDSRIQEAQDRLIDIGFDIVDINSCNEFELYKEHIKTKKFTYNWTENMLEDYINSPLVKALILLDLDYADCLVAGANNSTADVIRNSLRIVGLNKSTKWVSSCFFLINPNTKRGYTYADCGVIPEPDSKQLVSIAYQAYKTHKLISNEEPKVAFLSFSTKGSAEHYKVKRMQEAVEIFSKKYS